MDISTTTYFSMEVGVEPAMHTYSGGLGVLAGDMMRSAADMQVLTGNTQWAATIEGP
jgi:glycogen phosphorylase